VMRSFSGKNSIFGTTQTASFAPFGQRNGGRSMIGLNANGPYRSGFNSFLLSVVSG